MMSPNKDPSWESGIHPGLWDEDIRPGTNLNENLDIKSYNKNNTSKREEQNVSENLGHDFQIKKEISFYCKNVRGLSTEWKQELYVNECAESECNIVGLTEISLNPSNIQFILKRFKRIGNIFSSIRDNSYKGNGILAIIKYPLARYIIGFRKIEGRLLNILFRMRKHKELSVYIIQAPTALYNERIADLDIETETDLVIKKMAEFLDSDAVNDREIIIGGDFNSYEDASMDYSGTTTGQTASRLIEFVKERNLLDIMRVKNESRFFTFQFKEMKARLDQFWVTTDIATRTIMTKVHQFESEISDHAGIELKIRWPHVVKYCNRKGKKLHWDNKNTKAIGEWKYTVDKQIEQLNMSEEYCHSKFAKEYSSIANIFRNVTRKLFPQKNCMHKESKDPPIWFKVSRCIRKIISRNTELIGETIIMLRKYFPLVERNGDWTITKTQIRLYIKRLLEERKKKKIIHLIENRYTKFTEDISSHLDRILERSQKIDTSYIIENEIYVTESRKVKEYFKTYYEELFWCKRRKNEIKALLDELPNEFVLTQKIDVEEFDSALRELSKNKSGGRNGTTAEMLQNSSIKVQDWLLNAFNNWLQLSSVPKYILKSQIWLIPKGIYDGNVANTRPINLIDISKKLFSMILVKRMSLIIEKNELLKGMNCGFREELSTIDAIKSLQTIIEHSRVKNKQLCLVLLDIKKAYDSLEPVSIIKGLRELRIDVKYRTLIANIMSKRKARVLTTIGPTEEFQIRRGLEQGDPSSPILWNIFYETILKRLNDLSGYNLEGINVSYMAYADDIILVGENEENIENLLNTVHSLLTECNMEIQPKKSLQIANFKCKTFSVPTNENGEINLTVLDKKETFKYLGALFNLHNENLDIKETINDVEKSVNKMLAKRISIKNAVYIINSVILPKICYRMSGSIVSENKMETFDKMFRKMAKKILHLPKTFPSKLLYNNEYLIQIKPSYDLYVEQEIGNVFLSLCKQHTFVGKLFNKLVTVVEKCHPVFSTKTYKTESNLVNCIWDMLNDREITFIKNETLFKLQEKNYTCQYFQLDNHNEIGTYIKKKNILNINDIYRFQRNQIVLKKYESFATKEEIKTGKDPPYFWGYINEYSKEIIDKISIGVGPKYVVDYEEIELKVVAEYWDKIGKLEILGDIWIDGSFFVEANKAGAAVIVETLGGQYISITRALRNVRSSTEVEMYALWCALIIAKSDPRIARIKTDSEPAKIITERSNDKIITTMKNGNWTLAERLQLLYDKDMVEIVWVKSHSGIKMNEIADKEAKKAAEDSYEYIMHVNKASKIPWTVLVNSVIYEKYPRRLCKAVNTKARGLDMFNNSGFGIDHYQNKSKEQKELWLKTMKRMNGSKNISFEEEKLISFIMKLLAGILPCNLRQFNWSHATESKCSLCNEIDDNFHFFECLNLRENRKNLLYEAIEKCPGLRALKNGTLMEKIKNNLLNNASYELAIGFIPVDTIQLWKDEKIDKELVLLGKNLFICALKMWKLRCQMNQVKFCRTSQKSCDTKEKKHNYLKFDSILKSAANEITTKDFKANINFW